MSLLSGQISLTRFKVEGPAKISYAAIDDCLASGRAGPLRLGAGNREESFGWVDPDLYEDSDTPGQKVWGASECKIGQGIMLHMRLDRKKVPSSLVQALVRERLRAEEGGKGRFLSAREKKDLTAEVKEEALIKALPSVQLIEAYWRVATGDLYVLTTVKATIRCFLALFNDTFTKPLELTLIQPTLPAVLEALTSSQGKAASKEQLSHRLGQLLPEL